MKIKAVLLCAITLYNEIAKSTKSQLKLHFMLTNIEIAIAACQELNISYEILHPSQNLVRIKKADRDYYFVNYMTPFNSASLAQIFKDKEYTYQVLKGKINTPKTLAFVSPHCEEKYQKYLTYRNLGEMALEVDRTFTLPVIIKRNRGSGGNNVFLCETQEQIAAALEMIFNVNSKDYDYVALAQEYIEIAREYRAVFFKSKLVLLYEKDKSQAQFAGNLSPLHWEGAKAKHIIDPNSISEIEEFVKPVFAEISIDYAGFDVALDVRGKYWLIEINSSPNFDIFVRDNDRQIVVKMFKNILENWE